jgi:hypothetical protein
MKRSKRPGLDALREMPPILLELEMEQVMLEAETVGAMAILSEGKTILQSAQIQPEQVSSLYEKLLSVATGSTAPCPIAS